MKLLSSVCLSDYKIRQRFTLRKHLHQLQTLHIKPYPILSSSSVYSSLIEGSGIDMDSYLHNKQTGFENKEMKQIDDLVEAYQFAKTHSLTSANLLKVHKIVSRNFSLDNRYKGKLRDKDVNVGNVFQIVYRGAEKTIVEEENGKLFADILQLKKRKKLTLEECFYFASFIHLVFVKIHPFADGNGRLARLLEKWFLSQQIGSVAWNLPSEIYYYLKRDYYYKTLRIGASYEEVDYKKALPFLLMLPACFSVSKKYYTN
jgi:Fic family protein